MQGEQAVLPLPNNKKPKQLENNIQQKHNIGTSLGWDGLPNLTDFFYFDERFECLGEPKCWFYLVTVASSLGLGPEAWGL